jgi:uncharacterized small protein (DUF1192 family)
MASNIPSQSGSIAPSTAPNPSGETAMTDYSALSLTELEDRIGVVRDNIRQLIEQAAAASGERNEERIADRLEQQNGELESLEKARDALTAKR